MRVCFSHLHNMPFCGLIPLRPRSDKHVYVEWNKWLKTVQGNWDKLGVGISFGTRSPILSDLSVVSRPRDACPHVTRTASLYLTWPPNVPSCIIRNRDRWWHGSPTESEWGFLHFNINEKLSEQKPYVVLDVS